MEQTWALGTVADSPREIEIVSASGVHRAIPIEQATRLGAPKPAKAVRYVYEGDFTTWRSEPADAYLAGLGFVKPSVRLNRHQVFAFDVSETLTAHVPALVLMRAFFKPHNYVLSAVFRPLGLDALSFVDYCEESPTVVLDGLGGLPNMGEFRSPNSVSRERAIQWCQLSVSAREMSWSVFRNALSGGLSLTLPQGQARIVLHGVRTGQDLFVTQAALSYVVVPAEDSLTGRQEEYVFHAGADHGRRRYASVRGLSIPARSDGGYRISDAEWEQLEAEMRRDRRIQRYPYREVLDWIVLKIGSGVPWQSLTGDPKLVGAVKNAFRNWSADGRLGVALEVLTASRSPRTTVAV